MKWIATLFILVGIGILTFSNAFAGSADDMQFPSSIALRDAVGEDELDTDLALDCLPVNYKIAATYNSCDQVDCGTFVRGRCTGNCCCCPQWTFTGGALVMERARNSSEVLMQDAALPTRNLNANSFDFGFDTGFEVAAQRLHGRNALEIRFMMIDSWEADTSAINGAPTLVRINSFVPFFLPGVTGVTTTYGSELSSAEVNYRWRRSNVTWLAGFRYVEIDEALRSQLAAVVLPSTYTTSTENRLTGGQLGAAISLYDNARWTLDATGKAGLYNNRSQQRTRLDTGVVVVTAAGNDDDLAFLGEFGLGARRRLSSRCKLVLSYNLLWAESIAVASDQTRATNFFTSGGLDADGGVFYHGGFVGVEWQR